MTRSSPGFNPRSSLIQYLQQTMHLYLCPWAITALHIIHYQVQLTNEWLGVNEASLASTQFTASYHYHLIIVENWNFSLKVQRYFKPVMTTDLQFIETETVTSKDSLSVSDPKPILTVGVISVITLNQ